MIHFIKHHAIAENGYSDNAPLVKSRELLHLRVPIKALSKDGKWYFYRIMVDGLRYQCTCPGKEISIDWLKRQDQTEYGRLDDKARKKLWAQQFKDILADDSRRIEKQAKPYYEEVSDRCDFIARRFYRPYYSSVLKDSGRRFVAPQNAMVVGQNRTTGALIRAYPKGRKGGC